MSAKAFGGAVPGEDEYLELSEFLGQQRTKYDELRTTYREKQKVLKTLQDECEHLARITHLNDTSTDVFRDNSMALNKKLVQIRARTEEGQFRSSTYRHMLNRLEGDRLLLDKQLERLQHLKKEAEREHHHVKQMTHNQRQRRNQLEKKRRELADRIRLATAKREKRLEEAREALKEQVRMQTRRETREKKRRQIALEVAGDLGEEEEERLKKQYVTKQMYATFLAGKLEKNVARSSALQQGFQKIKNATGLSEVDDILQKYLTRDDTFESLQKAAKDAEDQIDTASAEQRELQTSLESIQLQGVAGQGNRTLYREIDQFDSELSEARKMCNEYKDRSMKASMTLEDVRQCVVKLARKLDIPSDTKELPAPELLPGLLNGIEIKVRDIVESLATFTSTMERKKMLQAKEAAAQTGGSGAGDELDQKTNAGDSNTFGTTNMLGVNESKEGGRGERDPSHPSHPSPSGSLGAVRRSSATSTGTGNKDTHSIIGNRARDMLYNSLMAVEPDTSVRNIRVLSKQATMNQDTRGNISVSVGRAKAPPAKEPGKSTKAEAVAKLKSERAALQPSGNKRRDQHGEGEREGEDEEDDAVVDRGRIKEFGRMMVQANVQRQRRAEQKAIAAAESSDNGKLARKKNRVPGQSSSGSSGKSGKSAYQNSSDLKRLEMLLGKDQAGKMNEGSHFKSDGLRQPRPPSGSKSSKRRSRSTSGSGK